VKYDRYSHKRALKLEKQEREKHRRRVEFAENATLQKRALP